MKTYVVPQFVILNNNSDSAIIQNKNGISQLTHKTIIAFFNKLDELHKNKFEEKFVEDFFGFSQYKPILKFLLDTQLIEEKERFNPNFNQTVVFTNSKKIYSLMSKVIPKEKEDLKFNLVNVFQSEKFISKINELSDDVLIVIMFSPLDLNEYTWTCDYLRKREMMYCTASPYDSKFYFSNIYKYSWKNACPKCFISELISSLRSTGKFYSIPTFQTVIDIIYNEDVEFQIYDFNNLNMNLEILKALLELSDSKQIEFFSSTHREIDLTGMSKFDQCVHWELCNCLE